MSSSQNLLIPKDLSTHLLPLLRLRVTGAGPPMRADLEPLAAIRLPPAGGQQWEQRVPIQPVGFIQGTGDVLGWDHHRRRLPSSQSATGWPMSISATVVAITPNTNHESGVMAATIPRCVRGLATGN